MCTHAQYIHIAHVVAAKQSAFQDGLQGRLSAPPTSSDIPFRHNIPSVDIARWKDVPEGTIPDLDVGDFHDVISLKRSGRP
jgi:hypothetical protein